MQRKIILTLILVLSSIHVIYGNEVVRILTIGNSFSEDAVENYLYDLGKADGTTLIIGNMVIGGCSLETHWSNANSDAKAYSYRKIDASGTKMITEKVSLAQALSDEEWDYVSFQQVSQNSGQIGTYFPYLTNLLAYAKERVTNKNVKYALHMTWAYAQNSSHSGFANYEKKQSTMYSSIVNTVMEAAEAENFDIIVPSGTAIQNARTSFIGDSFCRDGYHLNSIGRYTAACTWYEQLTGKLVVNNTYKPSNLTSLYIEIAKEAAHKAVENPLSITILSQDKPLPNPDSFELAHPVNIDFGISSYLSSAPWNNLSSYSKGSSIHGLLDMSGNFTPFNIEIIEPFGGVNGNGGPAGIEFSDWSLPKEASFDLFWGNAGDTFQGVNITSSKFLFSGLNPAKTYDFSILASRLSVSDNRETSFYLEGLTSEWAIINSANNKTDLAVINKMRPKEDGTMTLTVGAGDNNNNSNKFFYINALQIRQSSNVPQISGLHISEVLASDDFEDDTPWVNFDNASFKDHKLNNALGGTQDYSWSDSWGGAAVHRGKSALSGKNCLQVHWGGSLILEGFEIDTEKVYQLEVMVHPLGGLSNQWNNWGAVHLFLFDNSNVWQTQGIKIRVSNNESNGGSPALLAYDIWTSGTGASSAHNLLNFAEQWAIYTIDDASDGSAAFWIPLKLVFKGKGTEADPFIVDFYLNNKFVETTSITDFVKNGATMIGLQNGASNSDICRYDNFKLSVLEELGTSIEPVTIKDDILVKQLAAGELEIQSSVYGQRVKYTLFDIAGSIVSQGKLIDSQTYVSVNSLTSGVYLLQVKDTQSGVSKTVRTIVK